MTPDATLSLVSRPFLKAGPCNNGPVGAYYPAGRCYRLADTAALTRFVSTVLENGQTLPELIIHEVAQ